MRTLIPLLLSLTAATPLGAQQAPTAIVRPEGAPFMIDLAARELQRYLYQASGTLLPIVPESAGPCFLLGGPEHNPVARALVGAGALYFPTDLGEEGYVLQTRQAGGRTVTLCAGATPLGTLYAAYDLLERYGFGFYLGGDAAPEPAPLRFLPLDETRRPALKIRGSLPWYNFLNSPTSWNPADYRRFFDQMAKQRMNFVGFHAYDYEPFCGVKVEGAYRFGAPLQNTSHSVWGTVPMKTAEFGFGTGALFSREYFGADASFDYATPEEGIDRAQEMLADGLRYARERGIHVCVGFEVSGDPSDPGNERNLELRLRHVLNRYPMIEYLWVWQSEGRGRGGNQGAPPRNTAFGSYYQQVKSDFEYLKDPARIAEAVRVSYFAHLSRNIVRHWAPGVRVIVSGWGGDKWMGFSDMYVGLDKTLPPDVIFAALDNIDPSAAPQVSHAYGELSPTRERWPIPWFESDGGGTRRDQWGPQCNVRPFVDLCRDALAKGSQGILGIHWRTRGVEEVAAFTAQFAWDPTLTYEGFFDGFARRCFGEKYGQEMSHLLQELESLGPRWTGARGQVECGRFAWFSSPDRPRPENLARLAQIDARLTQIQQAIAPRHRERLDYLLHMLRWLVRYDQAAVLLQPGGEVPQAIERARQARDAGAADARELALVARQALQATGLDAAFAELSQTLTTRGDLGALATANAKAYAAYRDLEQRLATLLPSASAAKAPPVPLQVQVPVTPDRLEATEPLVVEAIVSSDRDPVVPRLMWRQAGSGPFAPREMAPVARCVYRAQVPAEQLRQGVVEFYAQATDASGASATMPPAGAAGPYTACILPPRTPASYAPREPQSGRALPGPVHLNATVAGPYEVALRWAEPDGSPAHHWEVWRGCGEALQLIGRPRLPGLQDYAVAEATRYTYSVRPVDWEGKASDESTVELTTTAFPPPERPAGLEATPGVRSVRLTWPQAAPGVGSYRILRGGPGETLRPLGGEPVPASDAGPNMFVDRGVPPDVELRYRVIPIALSGLEGPASPEASASPWPAARPILTLPLDGSLVAAEGFAPQPGGATEFVAAGARKALKLGPDRWLSVAHRPTLNIPCDLTLEAWARFDDVDGIPVLISHARWLEEGYFLQVLGGHLRLHLALQGGALVLDAGTVPTGRWVYLAGTFDGQTARCYLDGRLVGAQPLPPGARPALVDHNGPLYVGRYRDPGPQYEVHGLVANIAVWSGARTEEELRATFDRGRNVFP
jgi:hypothetical protein